MTARLGLPVLVAEPWEGYGLIDSGDGRKLERFGCMRLVRPEPQAMWRRTDPAQWDTADARFEGADDDDKPGRWTVPPTGRSSRNAGAVPDFRVPIGGGVTGGVTMVCRLTANRHVGLFPEQRPHWDAMAAAVRPGDEVLNLFGYTGAASLLLAAAGARVTHVDASKKVVAWGHESQSASGLDDAPVRWIVDDAQKFVAREVRRERRYNGIVLDPPKFGRGPKNETWNLFDDLGPLIADVARLVADDARFVVLTAYAIRASALAIGRLMEEAMAGRGGTVTAGELALREEASGRLLPTSMFAVWRPESA